MNTRLLFLFLIKVAIMADVFSQGQDYLILIPRSELLECGSRDTVKTKNLLNKLLSIHEDSISDNKSTYYHDIALCYYKMYSLSGDTGYLNKIIHYCEKAIQHDSTFYYAYNTLYVTYIQKKYNLKVVENIDNYIKYSPEGLINKKEMRVLRKTRRKYALH